MNVTRTCPSCGKPLPTDAPSGLCPICLLKTDAVLTLPTADPPGGSAPTITAETASAEPASALTISPAAFTRVRYFGDYELQQEIARGGMGVVWKARQLSLDRPVAVKMILAGQLASEAEVRRFHVEAEAAANLQHPNIVAIHEIGEHECQHFFSMDLIEGKSLAARLGEGPLAVGEAARLARIMAEAIHYAHQHGVLHRDLKPANVLLDAAGQPHLTDFGLAKRADRDQGLTGSGAVFGTPSYMPPEQAAGRQDLVSPASDTYALGAMLYEMLTGQPPFRGSTPAETISHVVELPPTPPGRLNPRVPRDLATICLKCLEKRPDLRYATAELLAKDLDRFLNHEPIQARPASGTRKAYRWLAQHPSVLSGLGTLLVLGVLWTTYGLWAKNRFLVRELAHPGELEPASLWLQIVTVPQLFLVLWIVNAQGIDKLLRKRIRRRVLTGHFVPQRVLVGFGLVGLIGIVSGIYIGTAVIQEWDNAQHALPKIRSAIAASKNPAVTEIQLDLKETRGHARRAFLWIELLGAGLTVWSFAGLIGKVWREHKFLLYNSTEEEQFARRIALDENLREQAERAQGRQESVRTIVAGSLLCMGVWCLLEMALGPGELRVWLPIAQVSGWWGGLCACAPRRGVLRRRLARPVLLLVSILTAVASIVARPNAHILTALLVFAAFGAALGGYLQWKATKDRLALTAVEIPGHE